MGADPTGIQPIGDAIQPDGATYSRERLRMSRPDSPKYFDDQSRPGGSPPDVQDVGVECRLELRLVAPHREADAGRRPPTKAPVWRSGSRRASTSAHTTENYAGLDAPGAQPGHERCRRSEAPVDLGRGDPGRGHLFGPRRAWDRADLSRSIPDRAPRVVEALRRLVADREHLGAGIHLVAPHQGGHQPASAPEAGLGASCGAYRLGELFRPHDNPASYSRCGQRRRKAER